MKQRELYLEKIILNDQYSLQIDPNNQENLLIYENNTIIEEFSLRKRIHTLFKTLQDLTEDSEYIMLDQKTKLYSKEIKINDNIYMKVTDHHVCVTVDFYQKNNDHSNELLYLTKMTYMTQKLFNKLLIPEKVIHDEHYQDKNTLEFKDMLEVLTYPNNLSNA